MIAVTISHQSRNNEPHSQSFLANTTQTKNSFTRALQPLAFRREQANRLIQHQFGIPSASYAVCLPIGQPQTSVIRFASGASKAAQDQIGLTAGNLVSASIPMSLRGFQNVYLASPDENGTILSTRMSVAAVFGVP